MLTVPVDIEIASSAPGLKGDKVSPAFFRCYPFELSASRRGAETGKEQMGGRVEGISLNGRLI